MAPRQFIDFLRWAEAYHQELHDYYASRSVEAQRPEVKALLQYMARHEDILRRVIDEHEHGAPAELLEAWFGAAPDLKAIKHPEEIGLRSDMTTTEVINAALELDDSLIDVYRVLQREATCEELVEALEDLLAAEEEEEVRLLRSQLVV